MKKNLFTFCVAIFATALLTSCGSKCDKNDPASECYEDSALTTDAGVVINGVKWATRNVDMPGKFAVTLESSGMFYQWNRKIGWSATDPMVNSNGDDVWDYTMPEGTEWEKANDPCPQGWRVPTIDELRTLLDEDKVAHGTACSDVIFRSFIDKTTEEILFLPVVGYRHPVGTLLDVGLLYGVYWSNTQYGEFDACCLSFNSDYANWSGGARRSGFSVRCVAE